MNRNAIAVLLAAVVVFSGYLTARGQSASPPQPTKVAVVNLAEVLRRSAQQEAIAAERQTKAESLQREEEKRRKEIQTLNEQLTPLNPGSSAWEGKRQDIQKKVLELEVWARWAEQESNRERAKAFADMYSAATEATQKVAEALGFDLVVQKSDLPDTSRMTPQNLQELAVSRKVIYSKNAIDITEQVLLQADAAYKGR